MPIRVGYLLVAALAFAPPSRQGRPPRSLGAPTATHAAEFTGIEGVRELRDGRVVVLDAQDKAIHVIDLKAGSGVRIGRDGDGPGEFRLPLEIWPVGDSAVVRDMARFAKLMVVTANGRIGGFVSMLDSAISTRSFNPTGVDAAGRYYGLEPPSQNIGDSAAIVRWDLRRATRDTVARFTTATSPPKIAEADIFRDASGRILGYRPTQQIRVFTPYNEWAVAADGRVAIIQGTPYRVVYVTPDKSRVTGPVVSYRPVPVTNAEKDEWRAGQNRAVPSISRQRGGEMAASFRKVTPPDEARIDWADVLPPFSLRSARFASDGLLWVQRSTRAAAPPLFDVFDAAGKVAFQVELPSGRKLLGFGTGAVYLARVDEDDLHYLERYKLPSR